MRKFAIRVVDREGLLDGYVAAYKDGEDRIMGAEGYRTMLAVRDAKGIRDAGRVPFWETRQQCHEALMLCGDAFHDRFAATVEELPQEEGGE